MARSWLPTGSEVCLSREKIVLECAGAARAVQLASALKTSFKQQNINEYAGARTRALKRQCNCQRFSRMLSYSRIR